jgi:hypothetical protein
VIRTHRGGALLGLVKQIELKRARENSCLLAMPMCHGNSLYFFGAFAQTGATCHIYSRESFDPEHAIRTLADKRASLTSLAPTHYIMTLGLTAERRAKLDLSSVEKLVISSAPARPDTKRAVMEMFRNSGLYELYGSSEAGWVTMLHPAARVRRAGRARGEGGRLGVGAASTKSQNTVTVAAYSIACFAGNSSAPINPASVVNMATPIPWLITDTAARTGASSAPSRPAIGPNIRMKPTMAPNNPSFMRMSPISAPNASPALSRSASRRSNRVGLGRAPGRAFSLIARTWRPNKPVGASPPARKSSTVAASRDSAIEPARLCRLVSA